MLETMKKCLNWSLEQGLDKSSLRLQSKKVSEELTEALVDMHYNNDVTDDIGDILISTFTYILIKEGGKVNCNKLIKDLKDLANEGLRGFTKSEWIVYWFKVQDDILKGNLNYLDSFKLAIRLGKLYYKIDSLEDVKKIIEKTYEVIENRKYTRIEKC